MFSAIYSVPRVVGGGPDATDMDGVYGRLSGLWSVEEEKPGEKGTAAAAGRVAGIGIFCFVVFFPGEECRNWGVGGVYAVVLWPAALLTAIFGSEQT